MSYFSGQFRGQKSLGPLKMSLEMAHKVSVPQKKNMSPSFLNSGTLIVNISLKPWFKQIYINPLLKRSKFFHNCDNEYCHFHFG